MSLEKFEQKKTIESQEKMFKAMIEKYIPSWQSTIDGADVPEEVKEKFHTALDEWFKDLPDNVSDGNPGDQSRSLVVHLLSILEGVEKQKDISDEKKEDSNALFEILRDDIWTVYKEYNY